jgi:predicted lipoprotein with Yx(FWY)xxD motif
LRRIAKPSMVAALVLLFALGVGAAYAHRSATKGAVDLRSTPFGKVLVSANGHTLYLFRRDKGTKSTCYGTCATDWPPLLTKVAKPGAGTGVTSALISTTRRKDGKRQITYRGHPLYWFFLDKKAGQTKGQGQNFFGGKWYVLDARGLAVVKAPAGAGGMTTTATTTGGTTTTTCGGYCHAP